MATLSPQLFAILSALVEERLGLHYSREDSEIFGDKVLDRAREAGFESALDYYYFLRYDPAAAPELDALADALVVGETYFFREVDSLRAAVEHAVKPAVAQSGRARIWVCASATGEEPVSLSLLLQDAGIREECEIVATDLSLRALAKAREGVYGSRSTRALPPTPTPAALSPSLLALAEARIVRHGSRVEVSRSVVDAIDYRRMNLLDEAAILQLGQFDLIVCRNVLIYFADTTVKRVVTTLARAMRDDARLLVGASESLLRFGTVLRCEERSGAFLYAKEGT